MARTLLIFIIAVCLSLFLAKHSNQANLAEKKVEVPRKIKRIKHGAVLIRILRDYGEDIKQVAESYHHDPKIITAILVVESSGDPYALSSTGAKGCMQTKSSADIDIGMSDYDSFDCPTSIVKGAKYLARIRDVYGFANPYEALVAYSDGPNRAKEYTMEELRSNNYVHNVRAVMKKIPDDAFL